MRITPTKEQIDYLSSIGVSDYTIDHNKSAISSPQGEHKKVSVQNPSDGLSKCIIILIILILIISLAKFARSEEIAPKLAGNASSPVNRESSQRTDPSISERLITIEHAMETLRARVARASTGDQVDKLQNQVRALDQQITVIHGIAKTQLDKELQLGRLKYSVDDKQMLMQELDQQRTDLQKTIVLFVLIGALTVGLLIIGKILMEKRIGHIEQNIMLHTSEQSITEYNTSHQQHPLTPKCSESNMNHLRKQKVDIEAKRFEKKSLPTPTEQMRIIINSAEKSNNIRIKPTIVMTPWSIGMATVKGNVRSENQDYGLCFQINGHDVLIVADGCGGVPHGQRAAHLAAVSAAVSIVRTFGISTHWCTPHVKEAASKAVLEAAHRLTMEGDKFNIADICDGLRTTLIVIVANKKEIGYTYIGDGGGFVIHTSGELVKFLQPQKANGFAMNVLAASLGPMMEGKPVVGTLRRAPGDLLIVGTDGIFDRVDNDFPKEVLRGCIQFKGNLQKTSEHILDELAQFQDNAGYVCDDNLTLGIMSDGTAPRLPPGFWSSKAISLDEYLVKTPEMEVT